MNISKQYRTRTYKVQVEVSANCYFLKNLRTN